ncbi:hypothetical protein RV03_GL001964 [Enterococcus gallinarum]|nr:hypothetical protein RV03_GL001964 [Enterococcus gallinarum]
MPLVNPFEVVGLQIHRFFVGMILPFVLFCLSSCFLFYANVNPLSLDVILKKTIFF